MFVSLKRVINNGCKGFSRNMGLSLATIFIMDLVILLATLLFLLNPASKIVISTIKEKVDISVYFKEDVLPEDILEVKLAISEIPEVKNVEYVPKEKALETFIEKHKDDKVLMESLTEVGRNPFLACLNIKAWQASQYEQVVNFLETGKFKNLINKVDYYKRKPLIDNVYATIYSINRAGFFLSIVLGIIAILVAFNTIRIAIYSASEEISIMRLVGASNWFIRGPFLIQGVIVGFISAIIVLIITFAICYGFDAKIKTVIPEISIYSLFISNFWNLFLIQLATGIGIGAISGLIAIRKYLKI